MRAARAPWDTPPVIADTMDSKAGKPQSKKPYAAPDLRTYGSVEELTGQRTGVSKAHLGHNHNANPTRPYAS